ncbi:hypothetical protein M011DRAFT_414874 [Sporormia fimetaria CBS 119925]|uniref:Uncharacterized protein n=1 Tax=Sporormia fimetaria CBS 119925 TaxID=1340428 RepID=A0A6A6VRL1_9PLEO|nr:hypothetical protein M011DRAFT_414874 [Sporormia fimetaria CBS 119925]
MRCEAEPIHTPGAVQSYGMLVGLEILAGVTSVRFACRVVSENSAAFGGYHPRDILEVGSFEQILPLGQQILFRTKASVVRARFEKTHETTHEVFRIELLDRDNAGTLSLWCSMHFLGQPHNLLICEFEKVALFEEEPLSNQLDSSFAYDLSYQGSGVASEHTFNANASSPNQDMFARLRRGTDEANTVYAMSRMQEQLAAQSTVEDLLDTLVAMVWNLTQYHHTVAYCFDDNDDCAVISEVYDSIYQFDSFKGLRFPAGDIPCHARDLYTRMKVRILFDWNEKPSRLVTKHASRPLDMTYCYLRAMSPVHLMYMKNMGSRSSMSMSLMCKNRLWGVVTCLSYGPDGFGIPFPVLDLCQWIGLSASSCLEKVLLHERLTSRRIPEMVQPPQPSVFNAPLLLSASSAELLSMFKADFGFLVIQGEARTVGKPLSHVEAVTLLRYVHFRAFKRITSTRNISKDFPDLVYKAGFAHIAGFLCIPLSEGADDLVLLFRGFQEREVHWAGKPTAGGVKSLEPRTSFKKWTERVKGTCSPWTEEQLEAAVMTQLVYGSFIKVWREKEAILQETRLKRLLITNLSHEARTPLNAVLNYLEVALEQDVDLKMRNILNLCHSASKSVDFVIDELLDLTGAQSGPSSPLLREPFDLQKSIWQTFEQFREHAVRKDLTFRVIQEKEFPTIVVLGDNRRLQQAIANVLSNAFQYTDRGGVTVRMGTLIETDRECIVTITVKDTGKGMSKTEVEKLFQELEEVEETELASSNPPSHNTNGRFSMVGLGLAVVARFVKHAGGHMRVTSAPAIGTTFSLEIPFELADDLSGPTSQSFPADLFAGHSDAVPTPAVGTGYWPSSKLWRAEFDSGIGEILVARRPSLSSAMESTRLADLPELADLQEEGSDALNQQKNVDPISENLNVIVADDNNVNCAILKRRLEKKGHTIQLCRDGLQAVEAYQKGRRNFDFVLMDLNMPILDGLQATQMIRAIEQADCGTGSTAVRSPGSRPLVQTPFLHLSPEPSSRLSAGDAIHDRPRIQRTFTDSHIPAISLSTSSPSPVADYHQPSKESLTPRRISYRRALSWGSAPFSSAPLDPPRIPIFAISANLKQHSKQELQDAGFDGWLPKPVDFARLDILMKGGKNAELRQQEECTDEYCKPGCWFRTDSPGSASEV